MSSQLSRLVRGMWKRRDDPAATTRAVTLTTTPAASPTRTPAPEIARAEKLCREWLLPETHDDAAGGNDSIDEQRLSNPLWNHFDRICEGPGIWKWEHYFEIYHRHLAKFVSTDAHIVEVGVYSGGSLGMWREYFGPGCRISGIDIEEACRVYAERGVEIYIGDQADRDFWRQFRRDAPPFDVVLDDGGHQPEQQMVTLEETLPYLRPGGVYLCEDVHGAGNEFAAFAQALADKLNADLWRIEADPIECYATPFQAAVHSVHCYPFVVVIESHALPRRKLVSMKRGTQWQPFLCCDSAAHRTAGPNGT